jgi:hypothetical protein
MTKKLKERLIEVMEMIAKDAEFDAEEMDGQPFNGKNIAKYMGHHGASIASIADAVRIILEEEK